MTAGGELVARDRGQVAGEIAETPEQTSIATRKPITFLQKLRVRALLGGETIVVRCSGKGCPLKRKQVKVGARKRVADLTKLIKNGRLRPGGKVTVEISLPGYVAKIFTFTARRSDNLKIGERCKAPGTTTVVSCDEFRV